jgi:site-specific DNA-cytosine methylase
VFVVGCLGDWRSAAAVLFERHSLSGHPAPSRQARAADGPRYKALGNSWAVPCARWIGQRINHIEALHSQREEIAA